MNAAGGLTGIEHFLETRNSTICFNISAWTLQFVFGIEPSEFLGGLYLWCHADVGQLTPPSPIFLGKAPHAPKNKMEMW